MEDHPQLNEKVLSFADLAANNTLYFPRTGLGETKFGVILQKGGVNKLVAVTADDYPAAGKYWIFVCCNGTNIYAGFLLSTAGSGAIGQPTKWSDIPAGQKISAAATVGWGANTFDDATNRCLMRTGATYAAGKVYKVVLSASALIDFNS